MILKVIFSIIGAALIIFFTIGFYNASKLQNIFIQKTVHIKADKNKVFDQVVYLKNFPKWSPFLEADPTQKIEIKGTDGKVGAQYHWKGDNGKDLGCQEIKRIDPLRYIKLECDIQKPFKANPVFEYSFSQENGNVKVTQDFHLKSGFVDAFFMWLFGAKMDMSKMNGRGMELLKTSLEK